MNRISILLVEDNEQDQSSCRNAVDDFNHDNHDKISLVIISNVKDAIEALNKSHYDGAIIDMRLADQGNEGNFVIDEIKNTLRRIPVYIMTGTPDAVEQNGFPLAAIYKKGETPYSSIIEDISKIYSTGLTKIMGGKGEIEQALSAIFMNNLLPHRNKWILYAEEDSTRTEKALLRHALNHLLQILDGDVEKCYPEEFYIHPPISSRINTGCIVRCKTSGHYYAVMNPACDLAERDGGNCNTDRALLAKVDLDNDFIEDDLARRQRKDAAAKDLTGPQKIKAITEARKHKTYYYHWLPETDFFPGGFINFRKISTHTQTEFDENFHAPLMQISSPFLKDIIARFSSYYARQGQPDIDHKRVQIRIE